MTPDHKTRLDHIALMFVTLPPDLHLCGFDDGQPQQQLQPGGMYHDPFADLMTCSADRARAVATEVDACMAFIGQNCRMDPKARWGSYSFKHYVEWSLPQGRHIWNGSGIAACLLAGVPVVRDKGTINAVLGLRLQPWADDIYGRRVPRVQHPKVRGGAL